MNAKPPETNHPKPVDVLAVLDDAISDYCDRAFTDRGGVGPELIKARAAVAELIEAANGARAALANGYEIRNRRRALELALARVQGDAA